MSSKLWSQCTDLFTKKPTTSILPLSRAPPSLETGPSSKPSSKRSSSEWPFTSRSTSHTSITSILPLHTTTRPQLAAPPINIQSQPTHPPKILTSFTPPHRIARGDIIIPSSPSSPSTIVSLLSPVLSARLVAYNNAWAACIDDWTCFAEQRRRDFATGFRKMRGMDDGALDNNNNNNNGNNGNNNGSNNDNGDGKDYKDYLRDVVRRGLILGNGGVERIFLKFQNDLDDVLRMERDDVDGGWVVRGEAIDREFEDVVQALGLRKLKVVMDAWGRVKGFEIFPIPFLDDEVEFAMATEQIKLPGTWGL